MLVILKIHRDLLTIAHHRDPIWGPDPWVDNRWTKQRREIKL